MTHLDLFSGIGGFALAAKWAGFETKQFVEIEPFCQKILNKNFPGVPCHGDIKTFDATSFMGIGLVTGGFPCQDVSTAGKGGGLDGDRSGLWFDMLRVVQESRPLFMLAENSPALRTRGIDRMLDGLEAINYAAWPVVVGAGNAGAPHLRKRCFVLAADAGRFSPRKIRDEQLLRNLNRNGSQEAKGRNEFELGLGGDVAGRDLSPNAAGLGWHEEQAAPEPVGSTRAPGASLSPSLPWRVYEPGALGVDAGLPNRVDRVRALGNAVVPHVVFPILNAIAKELQAVQA